MQKVVSCNESTESRFGCEWQRPGLASGTHRPVWTGPVLAHRAHWGGGTGTATALRGSVGRFKHTVGERCWARKDWPHEQPPARVVPQALREGRLHNLRRGDPRERSRKQPAQARGPSVAQWTLEGVAGKVEKPWTHPAVWRVSVPRCDPVPSMSFTTRKQAEHVVHTTRTGQNCGLNGVSFAPVGDSRQHL